jgi:hypothetical protein
MRGRDLSSIFAAQRPEVRTRDLDVDVRAPDPAQHGGRHHGLCEYTRAHCYLSLKFFVRMGIPGTKKNSEAE